MIGRLDIFVNIGVPMFFLGVSAGRDYAPACDSIKCLIEDCLMPVTGMGFLERGTNVTAGVTGGTGTGQEILATLYPCELLYEGRFVSTIRDEMGKDYEEYACCMPGYDSISVEVLETCSTEACTTPDNKGEYFCLADGFIQLLNCDQDSNYKYSRKVSMGDIYSPYICCTTQVDQSNRNMLIATYAWTVLCGITFLSCMLLISAILKSAKARAQGYNLYLVFLALPDALFNFLSFWRNIANIANSHLTAVMGATVHAA